MTLSHEFMFTRVFLGGTFLLEIAEGGEEHLKSLTTFQQDAKCYEKTHTFSEEIH